MQIYSLPDRRRHHRRLQLDERHHHDLRDRAGDERHQLHRRPRRPGRRRRAHRQRRVLPLLLPARAADIAAELLQPRLAHRRAGRRACAPASCRSTGIRPSSSWATPGALLVGLLMATSAVAVTGQIDPASARQRAAAPGLHPDHPAVRRAHHPAARLRPRRHPAAAGPASRRSAPTASTCTTACSTWATRTCTPC